MKPLVVVDDPLGPKHDQRPAAAAKPAARGAEPTESVFARVPVTLARQLKGAPAALPPAIGRVTVADVIGALLAEYVDPQDPEKLRALSESIVRYRSR